jgi:hypothetical protein
MRSKRLLVVSGVAAISLAAAAATAGPALAASPPVSHVHIVAHFDIATGQQPENIALERDGAPDVTFAFAHQIARVTRGGGVQVLATLPAPPAGSAVPVLGAPEFLAGIVVASDGTRFVNYNTGTAALTGVWRVRPGGRPVRIAALPADSLANGLAIDRDTGMLYVTDSALGVIWRVPVSGGTPVVWASGPDLQSAGFLGANGLKVHDGAVWAGNTDKGLLLRIPILPGGAAGTIRIAASGVTAIDDFSFTSASGDTVLAAQNAISQVALIRPDGTHTTVLTAADGLSNPSSVAVTGHTIYVTSAAYITGKDPNLLTAKLACSVPAR